MPAGLQFEPSRPIAPTMDTSTLLTGLAIGLPLAALAWALQSWRLGRRVDAMASRLAAVREKAEAAERQAQQHKRNLQAVETARAATELRLREAGAKLDVAGSQAAARQKALSALAEQDQVVIGGAPGGWADTQPVSSFGATKPPPAGR